MIETFDYLLSLAIIKRLREEHLITQNEFDEIDRKNKETFC